MFGETGPDALQKRVTSPGQTPPLDFGGYTVAPRRGFQSLDPSLGPFNSIPTLPLIHPCLASELTVPLMVLAADRHKEWNPEKCIQVERFPLLGRPKTVWEWSHPIRKSVPTGGGNDGPLGERWVHEKQSMDELSATRVAEQEYRAGSDASFFAQFLDVD